MNLQEVKSFIRKASKEDINEISDQINNIIKERREKAKAQFSVGDLVKIIHNTVNPDKEFKIVKINRKILRLRIITIHLKTLQFHQIF